jgi:hypothetical protein
MLQAHAAGGHHAVDDATLLEPGQCEVEGWVSSARDGTRGMHVGPNCRVGPIEIGAAFDRERADGSGANGYSVQLKAVKQLSTEWSVGASLTPFRRPDTVRGTTALLMSTWAREPIALHVNFGRDALRGAAGEARAGAAMDWTFLPAWTAVLERYVESRTHYARAGVRWQADDAWNVDVSHALRLRGPGASMWTIGASRQFAGP